MTYLEHIDSQQPALMLLQRLGYTYISSEETIHERNGLLSHVVLEHILQNKLKELNSFEYKGKSYPFSEGNIQAAVNALKIIPDEGLVRTNEKIYDLLTLGKSFEETIQGDKKSFTLKYIDWNNIENNVFHVTDEYIVEGIKETRRPDLILFVNGIPFVVIENKRRDRHFSIDEAISQHIRNQKKEDGIPQLYHYAQLLLAVHPNEVKYGATGTPAKFWSIWKEEQSVETEVQKLLNSVSTKSQVLPTEQDRLLYCLCRKERLMELVFKFTLYDAGAKKIARYQQYFGVKSTLERIQTFNENGVRKGGLIWHTQGSGKSLTMVMLSKAITLEKSIPNAHVIIVTDRIDLDKQISKTFNNCGKTAIRATSGNHLAELIEHGTSDVVTTIIDKFETALSKRRIKNDSPDIFVLVDESHRSQHGFAHARMKKVLPNACYLGFTGTPLTKREKSTEDKFGGFIHKYTINQAVEDQAVLPLLYEGRSAKLSINKGQLDKGFDRLAEPLTEYQTKDLKRKFASISKIYQTQQVIDEIAYDISLHFANLRLSDNGFKGQLAVPSKLAAIKYQRYFDSQTTPELKINTAVVISPPDTREDHDDPFEDDAEEEVQKFWKKMLAKYQNADNYQQTIINTFDRPDDEIEIIIVVSKLLTGFDAPRNTVLYLAKPLGEHNLLQAIARVNRLFEGKEFGYIIDYVGILGKLDQALTDYNALAEFDQKDLEGAVNNIMDEVRKLPQRYSQLVDVFKEVSNKADREALERHLAPKDIRDTFYTRLSAFARNMQVALATDDFYKEFSEGQIQHYLNELKHYQGLRQSVQSRYYEIVNFGEYEARIKKLLDTYIHPEEIIRLNEPVNIFDKALFQEEVERLTGTPASKADAMAHRLNKIISVRMDEDPVFYKKFSELLEELIQAFIKGRMDETEYLKKVTKIKDDFISGEQDSIPEQLVANPKARAFFLAIKDVINKYHPEIIIDGTDGALIEAGLDIAKIVERMVIRDWQKNTDIQKEMKNLVEDYLLEHKEAFGISLTFDEIDSILDLTLQIAKSNY